MSPTKHIIPLAAIALSLLFVGCGSSEVVFEKGEPGQTTTTGSAVISADTPILVHVDMVERVATLRNGNDFGSGYLIAMNAEGNKTAVLKTLPLRSSSALRTADVLEGKPQINNTVRAATAAEASELSKVYRDAQ